MFKVVKKIIRKDAKNLAQEQGSLDYQLGEDSMAKIIDGFPKIIFCKIPEIIMLMIPNAGIIKM